MGSSNGTHTQGGGIVVTLSIGAYLKRLEAEEAAKPRGGRAVPTVAELAEAAGLSRGAMYNLVNGQVKLVNLEKLSAIISELQRRGFDAQLTDMLTTFAADELLEAV